VKLLLLLAAAALATAQPRAPQQESIRKEDLKADLYFLASDAMRGRLTGSPEYSLAAQWIESRFRRLGLTPAGEAGAYFQPFDLVLSRLAGGNRLDISANSSSQHAALLLEDFYPLIFSAGAHARGEVAFCGFGVLAPAYSWDDYRGDAVRGRIALVLDGDPGAADPKSPFDGLVTSEYSNALRKALWAQERGAIGVLFVNSAQRSFAAAARAYWPEKPPHLERYTLATYASRIRIPAAQISPALAEEITGRALADLSREAEKSGGVTARPAAPVLVDLHAELHKTTIADRNVLALIEGSDPKLKDETVIVSAHYDHNGATAEQIFNGADDNGSGTVALLEIAEAYALAAAQGQRPRRTVLFAAWGSEERCCGPLLGAWHWVEHPLRPLDRTVAVLNMDMIGRSEEVPEGGGSRFNGLKVQTAESNAGSLNLLGYSYSPDLSAAVDAANRVVDLRLLRRYDNNRSNLLRRSDQWPFLQRGVPALFFHTGLHPDYHTQYDRPEKIDYAKMERIARLVHQTSWDLATKDARPKMLPRREIPPPE
jgi:Zn-dependent M28 family amino/carboxypeptidase